MRRRSKPEDFWKHVDRNARGCWPWLLSKDDHGYGRVLYQRKGWKAHRLAWFLTYGRVPPLFVCHACDNPVCCRPEHLFSGTQKDNMADSARKGRHPRNKTHYLPSGDKHHSRLRPEVVARGERNGSAVLTEDNIKAIRQKRSAGATLMALAREFRVAKGTIIFITTNKTWRHVK